LFLANSIDYDDLLQVCRLLTHEIINKKPNLNEEELKKYISTSLYRIVRKIGYKCKKEYSRTLNESSIRCNTDSGSFESDSVLDGFNFYCGNSKKDDEIKKIEFKDLISFDKLEEKEKLVLERYIYHNNSFKEIGKMVGLSRRGTSYLYERAMKKVREEYFKNL
jgi:RNA polymerase sigma factor (sigma-70 family)